MAMASAENFWYAAHEHQRPHSRATFRSTSSTLSACMGSAPTSGRGSGGGSAGPMSTTNVVTDQLFASGPLHHHFLNGGRSGPGGRPGHGTESFVPFSRLPPPLQRLPHNSSSTIRDISNT